MNASTITYKSALREVLMEEEEKESETPELSFAN